MDDELPDLVRDWKLESTVCEGFTIQVRHISNHSTGLWRAPAEERWERVRRLGQGGFGVVWLEQCTLGPSTGKVRAVKQLQADFGTQRVSSNMLSRELLAVMKFSHSLYRDFFVESFGWYDSPESTFITMEYLPLGDLEAYIKEPLPETQTQKISKQILQGVLFMHQSKFAHRDLKPRNILVQHKGPDWWVKIADLGTSKQIESTVLRTVIGTEFYQAPEVMGIFKMSEMHLEDDPIYDLAVDMWAVGAITFRLITGQVAFPGKRDLFRYIVLDGPFPAKDIPNAQCREFITQTMSGSPRERPTAKQALETPWIVASHSGILRASTETRNDESPINLGPEFDQDASARWSTSSNTLYGDDNPTAVQMNTSKSTPIIVDATPFIEKERPQVGEEPAPKTSTSSERPKKRESNRTRDKRMTKKDGEQTKKGQTEERIAAREAKKAEKKAREKAEERTRRRSSKKRHNGPYIKASEDDPKPEKKISGKKKVEISPFPPASVPPMPEARSYDAEKEDFAASYIEAARKKNPAYFRSIAPPATKPHPSRPLERSYTTEREDYAASYLEAARKKSPAYS